jgi:hypothetical protein
MLHMFWRCYHTLFQELVFGAAIVEYNLDVPSTALSVLLIIRNWVLGNFLVA